MPLRRCHVVVNRCFGWRFLSLATVPQGRWFTREIGHVVDHLRLVGTDPIRPCRCSFYNSWPNDDHEIGSVPHPLSGAKQVAENRYFTDAGYPVLGVIIDILRDPAD